MEKEESILAGVCHNITVVKVLGKGNFQNSVYLKEYVQKILDSENPEVIIDLNECTYMDSTFMGTLAGISMVLSSRAMDKLTIVSSNPHVEKLLNTLGISYILDMRCKSSENETAAFTPIEKHTVSKRESVVNMLEAHKTLIEIDKANEVKFKNVLELLSKKLGDETVY